ATRKRNAAARPPRRRARIPEDAKPPRFYVSPRIDRAWFPDDHHWWCACYFVHLIRWEWCCKKANARGDSQLRYRLLEKVIPRTVLAAVKTTLTDRGVIECDGVVRKGKALGYRLTAEYQETHAVVCPDAALNGRMWRAYAAEDRKLPQEHRWLLET